MKQLKTINFVYKTTNLINGMIYIGVHKTQNINDKYLGSGKYLKRAIKKYGKENFKREILYKSKDYQKVLNKEKILVNENFLRKDNVYNIAEGGRGRKQILDNGKFATTNYGKITVIDKYGNTSFVSNKDPRYLSGELKHIAKNTVTVKDKFGNNSRVSKNDPRYLNGELVGTTKGQLVVKDKKGNISMVSKTDPRYLSGKLIPIVTNFILVKDSRGKCFQVDKNDPRFKSGELVGITKGLKMPNEMKEKLRKAHTDNLFICTKTEVKRVKKNKIKEYLKNGWKKGRIYRLTPSLIGKYTKKDNSK